MDLRRKTSFFLVDSFMFTPPETGNIRTLLQRWANDRPKAIHWCQSACRLTAKVPFFALCFEGKRRAGYGDRKSVV